jgi:hypothetical protein
MFHVSTFLFTAVLFYVLTPGILLSLPPKGSKMMVAATHALVFAVVFQLTYKMVLQMSKRFEGFQNAPPMQPPMPPSMQPSMMRNNTGSK